MSYGKARVHLMTLSVRTSGKGNTYLAGWLGKASVVAFAGEPDKFGNETWDIYVAEPEPPGRAGGSGRIAAASAGLGVWRGVWTPWRACAAGQRQPP